MKAASANATRNQKAYAALVNGNYFMKVGSYRQAQNEFNTSKQLLAVKPDSTLWAATWLMLGKASRNLGELPDALSFYSQALAFYDRKNDNAAQAEVHADIGQAFQLQGDFQQATTHLNTAVRLLAKDKDPIIYLRALHTLANVYGMRNELDSALRLDEEGLAMSRRLHLTELQATFLDNKAHCFLARKQYDSARILYNQCMAIDSAIGNKKQISDSWLNLALLELERGKTATAIDQLNRSLNLASMAGYRRGQMLCLETLGRVYKKNGLYEEALQATEQYFEVKDSLVSEKKESAIAEWKAIYETEKKDKEIDLQQALIQKKNLLIIFLCITLPMALLIVYFAYRRNKIRKEKAYREALFAREQQTATDILWAGEKERRRIAADLHDGVGQVLSAALLNLQALAPATSVLNKEDATLLDTAAKLVRNGCSEIRQISHHMMPVILLKNGLVFALQDFVNTMNHKALSIRLSIDMPEIRLSEAMEVMLYRVIQECVNNVVRHAHASRLDISITHEEAHISIMIEDNGRGIPRTMGTELTGIGMENIRSRVAYLHGTVEWTSVGPDGSGTLVVIYIPVS